jgi:hypothetical protein
MQIRFGKHIINLGVVWHGCKRHKGKLGLAAGVSQ